MYDYNWNLSWDSIKNPFVIKLHNLVVYLFLCCPIFRLAFTHVHFLSARSERLRRSYWSLNSKVDIKNMVWKPTLYGRFPIRSISEKTVRDIKTIFDL